MDQNENNQPETTEPSPSMESVVAPESPQIVTPSDPATSEAVDPPAAVAPSNSVPATPTQAYNNWPQSDAPTSSLVQGDTQGPPSAVVGSDTSSYSRPMASTVDQGASPRKKRPMKMILILLLAIIVLGGGSAAAYYVVIVPNQPANILKTALTNSLQQQQVSFDGTIQGGPAHGSGVAYKAIITGSENSASKAGDVLLNLIVSGANFTVEARLVDQNLYVKVGDLTTIANLLGAYSPQVANIAQALNKDLSNQWIEIDSTLLKQAGANCVLSATNWSLTQSDVQILENQYALHPFTTIQSTSNVTLNGQQVEKFVLSIDDDKSAAFAKSLSNLSLIKSLNGCQTGSKPTSSLSSLTGDHEQTPLTIWVNKANKQIVQIASYSTSQDAAKANISATGVVTLKYGNVSISAPSNAEPALQVLTKIETSLGSSSSTLLNLLGGGTTGTTGTTSI